MVFYTRGYGLVQYGIEWCEMDGLDGMGQCGMVLGWDGMVWYGMVWGWCAMLCDGIRCYGMV